MTLHCWSCSQKALAFLESPDIRWHDARGQGPGAVVDELAAFIHAGHALV